MNVASLSDAREWFHVLQTERHTQTALMQLEPGKASGEQLNTHPDSDQVLLVIEGAVLAEVGGERRTLRRGDVVIVPAGTPHRFSNESDGHAVTFNVYGPPAYGRGEG